MCFSYKTIPRFEGGTSACGRFSGMRMPAFVLHSMRCMQTENSSASSAPSLSMSERFQIAKSSPEDSPDMPRCCLSCAPPFFS